jgi:hypothetical protein
VYLAQDDGGGTVAIKVLAPATDDDGGTAARFSREADAALRLHHPNAVRALAAGEEQGWRFLVMEHAAGESLQARIDRDGPLPWREATRVVMQVARGLEHVHAAGLVHRDIKPENLRLGPDGAVKIVDFGLSKRVGEGGAGFRTAEGTALGTPLFLSPEQARGTDDVDARADLYSLGASYHALLTGRPPFAGGSVFEIVTAHLTEPPPDPRVYAPDVPEGAARVLRKLMSKRREGRYRDAGALIADLDQVLAGRPPAGASASPAPERARRWSTSRRSLVAGAAAALAAGGVTWWRLRSGAPAAVDLLALIDPARHAVVGQWRRDGRTLVCPVRARGGPAVLAIPHRPAGEYDLEAEVTRRRGSDAVVLMLAFAGRRFAINMDAGLAGRRVSALRVNGAWRPMREGALLPLDQPVTLAVSVRQAGLAVRAGGAPLFAWPDYTTLSAHAGGDDLPADMALLVLHSEVHVTRLLLTPVARREG